MDDASVCASIHKLSSVASLCYYVKGTEVVYDQETDSLTVFRDSAVRESDEDKPGVLA